MVSGTHWLSGTYCPWKREDYCAHTTSLYITYTTRMNRRTATCLQCLSLGGSFRDVRVGSAHRLCSRLAGSNSWLRCASLVWPWMVTQLQQILLCLICARNSSGVQGYSSEETKKSPPSFMMSFLPWCLGFPICKMGIMKILTSDGWEKITRIKKNVVFRKAWGSQ